MAILTMKLKTQKKNETVLYLLIWLILYATPLVSEFFYSITKHYSFEWHMVTDSWLTLSFFFVAFVLHNFFIAPLLVYHKQIWLYFGILVMLLICMNMQRTLIMPDDRRPHNREMREHLRGEEGGARFDPNYPQRENNNDMKPREHRRRGPRGKHDEMPLMPGSREMVMCCILLTLCGSNIGVKFYFKSVDDRKRLEHLEKHNLKQQLAYLKYQINPHFFMNTLNNIHALVSMNPPKAEKMIEVLSRLMRYVLYEADKPLVPLKQEVDFLNNYIELMRVRYTDNVNITMDTPPTLPNSFIPPLIFTTIVENAFKHGVSYNRQSFIHISVAQEADHIVFRCHNSRHPKKDIKPGGVGLSNVKQRLELLFHNHYELDIRPTETDYLVRLSVPLTTQNSLPL